MRLRRPMMTATKMTATMPAMMRMVITLSILFSLRLWDLGLMPHLFEHVGQRDTCWPENYNEHCREDETDKGKDQLDGSLRSSFFSIEYSLGAQGFSELSKCARNRSAEALALRQHAAELTYRVQIDSFR